MSVFTADSTETMLPARTAMPEEEPGPFLPAFIICDASSSMASVISELNKAQDDLAADLREHEIARNRVDIGIIQVQSSATMIAPMLLARDLQAMPMSANGSTALGEGIHLALDRIEARQKEYKQNGVDAYVPVVFCLTDAAPTDPWEGAAKRVHDLAAQGKLYFYGIGTSTANMNVLTQICAPSLPPLRMKDGCFNELFQFVSDSLTRISCSIPGQPVDLGSPAPTPGASSAAHASSPVPLGWVQFGS